MFVPNLIDETGQAVASEKMLEDLTRCVREKRNFQREMTYRFRSTDLVRDLAVTVVYVPPDMVMVLADDVSEKKAAEKAARQSEERFGKAFHANPAAIVLSEVETGRIVDANESFCRMYGFKREEAVGRLSVEIGVWSSLETRNQVMERVQG